VGPASTAAGRDDANGRHRGCPKTTPGSVANCSVSNLDRDTGLRPVRAVLSCGNRWCPDIARTGRRPVSVRLQACEIRAVRVRSGHTFPSP